MWGQQSAWLAVLAYLGSVTTVLLLSATAASAAPADPADDTLAVFCLSPAHRAELAAAARTLGLASPAPSAPAGSDRLWVGGRLTDLETWRRERPADFKRACQALVNGQPQVRVPQSPGFWTKMGEVLVPTAAGALLTFLATGWRASIDRGARDAQALRTAGAGFRDALLAYATEWVEGRTPSPVTVELRRADLVRELSRTLASHPSWRGPELLKKRLTGPELAEGDRDFWIAVPTGERPRERDRLKDKLDEFDTALEQVTSALSRPVRSLLPGSAIRRR